VNVNTASKAVLQALHADIDETVAENLIAIRDELPWQDLSEFGEALDTELLLETPGDGLRLLQAAPDGVNIPRFAPVSVNSQYFLLNVAVQLGTNIVELASLIHRNNANDVVVLARTLRYAPNAAPIKDDDE